MGRKAAALVIALGVSFAGVVTMSAPAAEAAVAPVGSVDSVRATPGLVRVTGWAADPDGAPVTDARNVGPGRDRVLGCTPATQPS
jgi:hypothetical protein